MQRKHRLALWLYFITFISGAYFYSGGGQNEAARYDSIRAVLVDHRFTIDNYVYNSADIISYNLHFYSSKAPGTFYLGLAPFAIFNAATKPFFAEPENQNIFAEHIDNESQRWLIVCYLTSVFSITLLTAICAPLLFLLLLRFGAIESEACFVSLAVSLGTLIFPFSTVFFSHAPAAALALLSFYLLFSNNQDTVKIAPKIRRLRLFLAGFAAGFIILLEYPAAIIALALLLYGAWLFQERRQYQALITTIFGFLFAMVLLMLYNYLSFDNAFYIPYEAYANDPRAVFAAHKKGLLGIRIPFLDREFLPIFFSNLAEITYRPLRGIFTNNPVLIFIFPGFVLFFRNRIYRKEAWLVLLLTFAYFGFNASYGNSIVYWGGGTSFGPRHLTPLLPFLALPIFFASREKYLRTIFYPVAALSFFFCLMATAIEPRAPYEPNNILANYYLPHFLRGELALTKEGIFYSIPRDMPGSIAFNWGSALGLPAQFQLLPLYLFLIGAAWYLDRKFSLNKLFAFASAVLILILAAPIIFALL